ncbi:hypothetical protein HDU84_001279 [Entophlyctis sp. JEL0112]|nr:hypothetical protein HDU84_001279 [Entophlyctis sp. JEL0112]
MGQAMGPCVYVDAETYVKSSPGSRTIQGWRNGSARPGVVVGLGHLRRCANLRCGRWEEGYKQFSKCSRCRRVSYCSKGCQRKAWVLHKNWCLKYTGDTTVTSTATTVPATQPSADGFAVNADGAETAATMDFAVPAPTTIMGAEGTVVLGAARQTDATAAFQALGAMRRRASSSVGAGIVVAGGVHVAERAGTFMDETNGGGVLGGAGGNGGLF